jgi:putative ABC transport system substrate-binding protein
MMNIQKVIEVARINKIPTASLIGGAEDAGVVLTISANPVEQGQKLAGIVKKVIGGTKPSDIPVMNPEKFDLCVNLKAAKAIGVDIPPELLKLATRIIE